MNYLLTAYAVFWVLTFALVLSVFARQKAVERDLSTLRQIVESKTGERRKDA